MPMRLGRARMRTELHRPQLRLPACPLWCFRGVDFTEKANVPATTILRDRNGIAQLRRIDANERAVIMIHDSPSLA